MMKNSADQTQRFQSNSISRRNFLAAGTAATASFFIVPRHVLGGAGQIPPSERVNLAAIGAGGMAQHNIENCKNTNMVNIVAICDVDDKKARGRYEQNPQASRYKDFRVMLDKEHKNIDAVVIATPDHTHAVATMAAIKMGKHVYTQKPLTNTIYEARMLTEAAREAKVITQMGTQGHSGEGIRLCAEWIADGAIGTVREAHCWTTRPGWFWPQGVERPKNIDPIPSTLDWDLWLGTAPLRPYNSCYLHGNWRGWWDFGCGSLGDMGCHLLDLPFYALNLKYPISAEATCTITAQGELLEEIERETAPIASIVYYEFPARETMPPVTLTWYDGGFKPRRPAGLESERDLPPEGVLFIGDKAAMLCHHTGTPLIVPESKMRAYKRPTKTIPRIEGGIEGHEADWLRSIKENKPASDGFEYAGPLTETVLMGNLAIRCKGKKLLWDGPNMTVTNVPEANRFVRREFREGWSL